MNVIYSVRLNVSEKNVLKPLIVKQKDSNSRYIDCAFFHGRFMLLIRSGNVILNVTRSDGQKRSFAGTINDNGTVRIPVANWMVENAGMLDCDISVIDGGEKLTSALFSIEVQASAHPDGSVSPDDPAVDIATILIERAEAAAAEATLAAEQIETEFAGAGVHGSTYTTIFDTAAVSTSIHSNKDNPWVLLTETSDLVTWIKSYRITFDNDVYIVIGQEWHSDIQIGKGVAFAGNASLWGNVDGIIEGINDVPFLVTSGMDEGTSHTEGLYLFTSTAGSHTIKIESIEYNYTMFPMNLVYGYPHPAVHMVKGVSSYAGYSMGENALVNKRSTFAIGFHNVLSGSASKAFGGSNNTSGDNGCAVGARNTVSGEFAHAFGAINTASGSKSTAIGHQCTASGANSNVIGTGCTASGQYAVAIGTSSTASGVGSLALGLWATASGTIATAIGQGCVAKNGGQLVFGMNNVLDPSENPSTEKGDYVEIVGNGANKNNRSNARTLDWEGNESLAGGLTLGKGTADEVTISAAQLKRLLELL